MTPMALWTDRLPGVRLLPGPEFSSIVDYLPFSWDVEFSGCPSTWKLTRPHKVPFLQATLLNVGSALLASPVETNYSPGYLLDS